MSNNDEYHGLMVVSEDASGQTKAIFNVFHTLAEDEYNNYSRAILKLRAAIEGSLRVYVVESLRGLTNLAQQVETAVRTMSAPRAYAHGRGWHTTLTCAVLTFSSALHLYQEQSEATVRKTYGADAPELRQTKDAFSAAYDGSLAYRLIYRLRNILVHSSLECVGLKISAGELTTPAGLVVREYAVRMPLLRNKLLETRQGVSAKIRCELESMPEDPDLLVLCPDAAAALESVHKSIFTMTHPDLIESARVVRQLDGLFGDKIGDRALVTVPADIGNTNPFSLPHILIPPQLFEYAHAVSPERHSSKPGMAVVG